MKGLIVDKIRIAAERVTTAAGLELVDAQLLGGGSRRVLKVLIDKEGGVSHGDCETVSRQLGELLDGEDIIPGEQGYTLEVSSPGVDRPLLKATDFTRAIGQKVRIQLREPREKRKRFEGILEAFDGTVLTLNTGQGQPMQTALPEIEKANIKYEW